MAESRSIFSRFFGFIWRIVEILRRVIITLAILGSIAFFALFLLLGSESTQVEDNIVLVWAPTGELVDTIDKPAGDEVIQQLLGEPPAQTRVRDLIKTLVHAADDDRVSMLFLHLEGMGAAGYAQLQELSDALVAFKASGKKVVTQAKYYSQAQYFLAANADEVYLDPMGAIHLPGFGIYKQYFKEGLDKLGLEMHVFQAGEYKSAVEPFLRNDMSPQARAAAKVWLNNLWDSYADTVAGGRKLKAEDIRDYANELPIRLQESRGDGAQVARATGLVDDLLTRQSVREQIIALVGEDEKHGSFRQINHRQYLSTVRREKREKQDRKRIALAVVQGPIVDGQSERGMTGSDSFVSMLSRARRDKEIKALVVRVNSPGGSITASEDIRREIARFQEEGKPVVISMSSLAASGGYWIAMDADKIFAQSGTLTGSIGVFGMFPTYQTPLAKMGITTDGIATSDYTDAMRPDMPMKPEVQTAIQSVIEHSYRLFVQKVAQGREMTAEDVDRIAHGRVWSGGDAHRLGLVDEIGSLEDALLEAAQLSGVDMRDYQVDELTPRLGMLDAVLDRLTLSISAELMPQWMSRLLQARDKYLQLKWLGDKGGVYSHCLCQPDIDGTAVRIF